ncbi:MAG: GxxExxY protein [Opitutales bacterium]
MKPQNAQEAQDRGGDSFIPLLKGVCTPGMAHGRMVSMTPHDDSAALSLSNQIRETAFEAHRFFKNGFLEKIYENSLARRLRAKGLVVEQQVPLKVFDEDGSVVGEYVTDLLVADTLIVELKAIRTLDDTHAAQVLAYLRASRRRHGMLINFGSPKLQVKKLVL